MSACKHNTVCPESGWCPVAENIITSIPVDSSVLPGYSAMASGMVLERVCDHLKDERRLGQHHVRTEFMGAAIGEHFYGLFERLLERYNAHYGGKSNFSNMCFILRMKKSCAMNDNPTVETEFGPCTLISIQCRPVLLPHISYDTIKDDYLALRATCLVPSSETIDQAWLTQFTERTTTLAKLKGIGIERVSQSLVESL